MSSLILVCFTGSVTSVNFDGLIRNVSDGTMEAYMIPPFKSNHASFLERLPNGNMTMAWFSGSKEGESDVAIVVSRLLNGTNQWTKASVVSQRKGFSNQNPVFHYDNKTQNLYLFHSQQQAKFHSTVNSEDSAEIWVLNSTSDGLNWTSPKVMFQKKGSFDRNRVVVSLNNTWLYPIYYAGGSSKDQYSIIKENVDHNPFSPWLEHPFKDSNYLVQPSVVRPVIGMPKLVVFFRDRRAQNIYRAESPDDGKTWSKPTKTTLPNNNSGIQTTVLSSGHFAIVYNPTNKARNPLNIALSEDEGMTWPHTRSLENQSENSVEFSYPTLLQDEQGRIHVSYTYNRDTIKYRVIPNEQWISQK